MGIWVGNRCIFPRSTWYRPILVFLEVFCPAPPSKLPFSGSLFRCDCDPGRPRGSICWVSWSSWPSREQVGAFSKLLQKYNGFGRQRDSTTGLALFCNLPDLPDYFLDFANLLHFNYNSSMLPNVPKPSVIIFINQPRFLVQQAPPTSQRPFQRPFQIL